jgi:hypothetical protein
MKRMLKIGVVLILLAVLSVACSNYVCPAYKGMIKEQSQPTKRC